MPNSTVAAAEKPGRDCRLSNLFGILRALGHTLPSMQAKYGAPAAP